MSTREAYNAATAGDLGDDSLWPERTRLTRSTIPPGGEGRESCAAGDDSERGKDRRRCRSVFSALVGWVCGGARGRFVLCHTSAIWQGELSEHGNFAGF